jgi:hypothetical protein
MKLSKLRVSLAAVVVTATAITVIAANASGTHRAYTGPGITPTNIAALTSAETRLAGVPDRVADLHFEADRLGDLSPAPGTVHALGAGALAWPVKGGGRICFTHRFSSGCLTPIHQPIDISGTDELVGSGPPMRVSGIATDEVESVTVRLDDGRIRTARPIRNFYDIELFPDTLPSTAYTVEARLEDGSTWSDRYDGDR